MAASKNIIRAVVLSCGLAIIGCADSGSSTTQPATTWDRQEKALNDPFSYGPDKDLGTAPKKADSKKDFKSDWENFWNP